uniref:uncharacterized protein LOC112432662 n=1 Tax=Maylandia zebra TaxID=106582 RepID=UPI000D31B95F|nr:uncharacterized protein LOC112432662 [Maylandia zebra]
MAKTFAHRQHEIVNLSPSIEDIKARWPALFEASHLQDEFYRITLVHLEPKFMSMLDEYTPKLLALFHSKGGAMGLKLQAIIAKSPSNPSNNITRNLVIQCLMVYLGESIDQLIKEYSDADEDGVSQDLSEQRMKIYKIKAVGSEEDDIGIVLEGVRVMPALGKFPRACAMLVSKLHALGYQPILFLGQFDRKSRIVGDVISHIEPAEGAARDILMKRSIICNQVSLSGSLS